MTHSDTKHLRNMKTQTGILLGSAALVLVVCIIFFPQESYSHLAPGDSREDRCNVSKKSKIIYDERPPRHNPDGSFYPGDKGGWEVEYTVWGRACIYSGIDYVLDHNSIIFSDDDYGPDIRRSNYEKYTVEDPDPDDTGIDKYVVEIETGRRGNSQEKTYTISGNFDVDIQRTNDCHGERNRSGLDGYLADYGGNLGYGGEDGWKWGREVVPNNEQLQRSPTTFTSNFKEVELTAPEDGPPVIRYAEITGPNTITIKFNEAVTFDPDATTRIHIDGSLRDIDAIDGSGTAVWTFTFSGDAMTSNAGWMSLHSGAVTDMDGNVMSWVNFDMTWDGDISDTFMAPLGNEDARGTSYHWNFMRVHPDSKLAITTKTVGIEVGRYNDGKWETLYQFPRNEDNGRRWMGVTDYSGDKVIRFKMFDTDYTGRYFYPKSPGNYPGDILVRLTITGGTDYDDPYIGRTFEIRQVGKPGMNSYINNNLCGQITTILREVEDHKCPPHPLTGDPKTCKARPTTHYHEVVIFPPTKAPVTETEFIEHIIKDPYGYDAANLDMTNYVWDPIAIEHKANFDYAEERAGTITFEYERGMFSEFDELFTPFLGDRDELPIPVDASMSPLIEEDAGYECDESSCNGPLEISTGEPLDAVGIGFLPYTHEVTNGGGMYAYTAPTHDEIGEHEYAYRVYIYNNDELINTHINTDIQMVVDYNPLYEHYEYPVLKDANRYTYDDRQGMVLYYGGSYGAGDPDNEELNPDRRSRLNELYPDMIVSSRGEVSDPGRGGNTQNFGTIKPPIRIPDDRMLWDGIDHINGTDPGAWYTTWGTSENINGIGDGHAIFYREGYGILRVLQDMHDIIFDDANWKAWYWNATTYNEVASDRWAGHNSFRNWNYTYQYQHAPTAQWFDMTAYDGHGSIYPAEMSAEITVVEPTHGRDNVPQTTDGRDITMMLDDYMYAKTIHDMSYLPTLANRNDTIFATGVVQELHPMENKADGTGGELSAWIRKIGLSWNHGYVPEEGILGMSRYDAMENDALMHVNMTSDGHTMEDVVKFEFWGDSEYEFVQGSEGRLVADRLEAGGDDSNIVMMSVPEKFGTVETIYINDDIIASNVECHPSCTVQIPVGGTIKVENGIGGTLTTEIGEPSYLERVEPKDTTTPAESNIEYFLIMGAAALVMYIAYKAFQRFWRDSGVSGTTPRDG